MENKNTNLGEIKIGIHKYNALKQKQIDCDNYNLINPAMPQLSLSEHELKLIANYEAEKTTVNAIENRKNYVKQVLGITKKTKETTEGVVVNTKNLYHGFLKAFKALNDRDFELTDDSILNIKAVVKYFAFDESFFECERLITKIDNKNLVPSFKKGILIVGDYGNGKSSMMKAFEYMINQNYNIAVEQKWHNLATWRYLRFKFKSCRQIASEYEFLQKDDSKQEFLKKYSMFNYCLDDITKEQIASNYGLKNVIQIVLENRYDDIFDKIKTEKRINRTHGTLNYHKDHPGNLKAAIQSLGVKYEAHIYDRALELFNIIEFKGKSFRK